MQLAPDIAVKITFGIENWQHFSQRFLSNRPTDWQTDGLTNRWINRPTTERPTDRRTDKPFPELKKYFQLMWALVMDFCKSIMTTEMVLKFTVISVFHGKTSKTQNFNKFSPAGNFLLAFPEIITNQYMLSLTFLFVRIGLWNWT